MRCERICTVGGMKIEGECGEREEREGEGGRGDGGEGMGGGRGDEMSGKELGMRGEV